MTFLIGLSATLVEPGLRAVVQEAETVSVGAIKSRVLLFATAVGVAIGMALGIAKIIYGWKTAWVVLPFLGLLILLILRAPDTFTALAWDCASATTGPVNIPINMMIALGVSRRSRERPLWPVSGLSDSRRSEPERYFCSTDAARLRRNPGPCGNSGDRRGEGKADVGLVRKAIEAGRARDRIFFGRGSGEPLRVLRSFEDRVSKERSSMTSRARAQKTDLRRDRRGGNIHTPERASSSVPGRGRRPA